MTHARSPASKKHAVPKETTLQEILEREVCKRVLSRGSERTLAGRTRGCGGLFKEEIQEGGGAEEKSDSQYGD